MTWTDSPRWSRCWPPPVTALWDDIWTCVGGPARLINTLERDPMANARKIRSDEDALPPGLTRE